MSKTALQIVNEVLVRLREEEVSDFSASYTKLILALVNETMQECQDAHQWEVLRATVEFDTVASQNAYELSATTDNAGDVISGGNPINVRSTLCYWQHPTYGKMPLAFDVQDYSSTTGAHQLYVQGKNDGTALRWMGASSASSIIPTNFYMYVDYGTSKHYVYFTETPASTRRINMTWAIPRDDVTATTDTVYIPHRPIVLGAYAKALSERGEELGPQGQEADRNYYKALQQSIMHDMGDLDQVAVPE